LDGEGDGGFSGFGKGALKGLETYNHFFEVEVEVLNGLFEAGLGVEVKDPDLVRDRI
jgi:hypothetical protein